MKQGMDVWKEQNDESIELYAQMNEFGTNINWSGRPRPGVVGYNLYVWTLTPEGNIPVKLHDEMLPLTGSFYIPNPDTEWMESDPLGEFLDQEPAEPTEHITVEYFQSWVDFLKTGRNPILRRCHCEKSHLPLVEPRKYFLVDLYNDHRQGGTAVMANRKWTDKLRKKRDKKIKDALEEIRKKGLADKIPGGLTLAKLLGYILGGVCGDDGDLEADGETNQGPKNPDTGKYTSIVMLNGNTVLDKPLEHVVALILHELVHVGQNLDRTINTDPKEMALGLAIREVEAYLYVWEKCNAIGLTKSQQAHEAMFAVSALMQNYRKFSKKLLKLEKKPTKDQLLRIKKLRSKLRGLLLKYKAFYSKLPKSIMDSLPKVKDAQGAEKNPAQVLDHILDKIVPSD